MSLSFGADFADVFEVRGLDRTTRGTSSRRWRRGGWWRSRTGGWTVGGRTRIELGSHPDRNEVVGDLVHVAFACTSGRTRRGCSSMTVDR